VDAARAELFGHAVAADLVELVDRHERGALERGIDPGGADRRSKELPVVDPHRAIGKAEPGEHLAPGTADLGLRHEALGAGDVDIALIELAKAATARPI